MKQKEKLDLILKALYKNRHGGSSSLEDIFAELKIPIDSHNEIQNLAKRLKIEDYIEVIFTKGSTFATITSYGIEYCEEDLSLAQNNYSINNTFNIQNISESPNSNIVSNSSKTNITIQNYPEIENLIKEIQNAILETKEISKPEGENLEEILKDITTCLKEGQNPKFSFQVLLSNVANIGTIGQLVIQLGKLIFFLIKIYNFKIAKSPPRLERSSFLLVTELVVVVEPVDTKSAIKKAGVEGGKRRPNKTDYFKIYFQKLHNFLASR